jgi:hypothetical protein
MPETWLNHSNFGELNQLSLASDAKVPVPEAFTEHVGPSRGIGLERDVEHFLDLLPATNIHMQPSATVARCTAGLTWRA